MSATMLHGTIRDRIPLPRPVRFCLRIREGLVYSKNKLSLPCHLIRGLHEEESLVIILGKFSLVFHKNVCYGFLELPHQDDSNERQQVTTSNCFTGCSENASKSTIFYFAL